jgi:hypothetical protein
LAWRSTTTWNRPGTADRGPRPGTAPGHHGSTKKIQNPPDLFFTEPPMPVHPPPGLAPAPRPALALPATGAPRNTTEHQNSRSLSRTGLNPGPRSSRTAGPPPPGLQKPACSCVGRRRAFIKSPKRDNRFDRGPHFTRGGGSLRWWLNWTRKVGKLWRPDHHHKVCAADINDFFSQVTGRKHFQPIRDRAPSSVICCPSSLIFSAKDRTFSGSQPSS